MKNIKNKIRSFLNKINKSYSIPGEKKLNFLLHKLSRTERIILTILILIFITSTFHLLWKLNNQLLVSVPIQGGKIVEGVVGVPRTINPLLATSASDKDLVSLIYSGLMRASSNNTLIPDLAESYEISNDGKTYTFKLKTGLTWHDGEPITSDDIVFTVQKAQDNIVRSTKQSNWDGVAIERVDSHTIRFILEQAYSPFLENTTLGILPKHLWDDFDLEFFSHNKLNDFPIGSGPYKIKNIKHDRDGIPIYYDLRSFNNFALGSPYISNIRIRFYPNELALIDALRTGEVMNINSISPEEANKLHDTYAIFSASLPRVFGAFYNQNQSQLFTNKIIRSALDKSVDKNNIIQSVLKGYGTIISGPIPRAGLGYIPSDVSTSTTINQIEVVNELLDNAGWNKNENGIRSNKIDGIVYEFSFSISTSDTPELVETATLLANTWEKIGAKVEVKVFEKGVLEQHVIRPRKYDVLLFGKIIGRDADLYPFWHSSQRLDPGLNIALYTNITVDNSLERARTTININERIAEYETVQKEIQYDIPATFLYSPEFIYITDTDIHNINIDSITNPSERFLNVHKWFIKKDNIWETFIEPTETITKLN